MLNTCEEHAAQKVANPNEAEPAEVFGLVVKNVACLAGEKIVASGADGEEADSKEQSPYNITAGKGILQTKENGSAKTDGNTGKNGEKKIFGEFFHFSFLFFY